MYTPVEGSGPVMSMGLVTSTNRHTALDATVVIHEFTHGVSNRLVGGAMNVQALDAPQSRGFGEGCSDYFACTITESTVVASWAVRRPGGLRGYAYDSNFPDDFSDLGTGAVHAGACDRRDPERTAHEVSATSESAQFEFTPQARAREPELLDMRDAILTALDHKRAGGQLDDATARLVRGEGIWTAFAAMEWGRGRGRSAQPLRNRSDWAAGKLSSRKSKKGGRTGRKH